MEVKTLLSSNGTATFAQMEQWLKSIQPGNEDLVFVYYSGHGGMENWETKRTFICTLDEYYPRRDTLVNSIEAFTSTARLRILITDCCSSTSEPPPVQVEKASALLSEQALKDLFLYHTGFCISREQRRGSMAGPLSHVQKSRVPNTDRAGMVHGLPLNCSPQLRRPRMVTATDLFRGQKFLS